MSNEGMKNLEGFVRYCGENAEAKAKVTEIGFSDPGPIIAYAKEKGYVFDEKDLEEFGKKVLAQRDELSNDDLEKVAGGAFLKGSAISSLGGAVIGGAVGGAVGQTAGAAVGINMGAMAGAALAE